MSNRDDPTQSNVPEPWRPRFTISTLLMVMSVFCVMAAAGSYLVRSLSGRRGAGVLVFILFTLAAPMLLMVLISILRYIVIWINRR